MSSKDTEYRILNADEYDPERTPPPWSDERIDAAVDAEKRVVEALAKVGEALKAVPVDKRDRVIRAVAILYGIEL